MPRPDLPVVPVRGAIRLGQFLKLAGLAYSGAEARDLILDGEVAVNGTECTQRGAHLAAGDRVTISQPTGFIGAIVGESVEDA